MDYKELSFRIFENLCSMEKPGRAAHSLSVAALSQFLCSRFDIEPEKGYAAGLAHDLCKNLPKQSQWILARRLSGEYESFAQIESSMRGDEAFGDHIIHGLAAAAFCVETFGVRDFDFLESLAVHSTGRASMSKLSKIVYISDKLEPGRITPEGTASALTGMGLDDLMLFAVKAVVEWFGDKKLAIADTTVALYNELSKGHKVL